MRKESRMKKYFSIFQSGGKWIPISSVSSLSFWELEQEFRPLDRSHRTLIVEPITRFFKLRFLNFLVPVYYYDNHAL